MTSIESVNVIRSLVHFHRNDPQWLTLQKQREKQSITTYQIIVYASLRAVLALIMSCDTIEWKKHKTKQFMFDVTE